MARTPRRVAIERIPGDAARQVSFSKRRQGLFKKVCELSTLCGAESAVLVHSPAGRVYSIGDPDVNTVVDRFLEHASQPGAAAEAGGSTSQQQGESSRAPPPQQQNRRGGPRPEIRRRVAEEELYRQLAEQDSWCDSAKLHRAALTADMKEKEARLPHQWGKKVQDLELGEAEEMTDALEEFALKLGDLIRAKEEEEGVPPNQRWSPDDPAPPPSNPWRQAAFMASIGHRGPWPPATMSSMGGGAANTSTFAQQAPPPPPPQNPYSLAAENYPSAAGFMGAGAGAAMGMQMPPMGGHGMGGMAPSMAPGSYNFAASSSSAALPENQLLQMPPSGEGDGNSTGLGPHNMFYR